MPDYKPYGEEWKADMMKLRKHEIIELFREVCLKLNSLRNELLKR